MAPLPSPESFELLETVEAVDARKIRRAQPDLAADGAGGHLRNDSSSRRFLAVPITDHGQVVLLRPILPRCRRVC